MPSHIETRRESIRLLAQETERRAGHADSSERSHVLSDLWAEAQRRELSSAQVHALCGLTVGTLRDCSLPTLTLHAALRHLRALPDSALRPHDHPPWWQAVGSLFGAPSYEWRCR